MEILLKSYRWHRLKIVIGILCASVVARINITYSGGSSNVFNNALNAPIDSICTSSIIYTLYFPSVGRYVTSSRISRMLSTPLLDAASISITFIDVPAAIDRHIAHSPHGLPSTGCSQLTAFANIFATVVFPVPLVPQNKYACPIRSALIWFFNVRTIASCPFTSSNSSGRNLRYNAVYDILYTPCLNGDPAQSPHLFITKADTNGLCLVNDRCFWIYIF